MLLRLLVVFYFAFGPSTFLVAQRIRYYDEAYDDLIQRDVQSNFGIGTFSQPNFLGQEVINSSASVKNPVPLGASFVTIGNVWAAVTSLKTNKSVIIRDSAADTSNLPLPPPQLVITNIQYSGCLPPCTGAGTCAINQSSPNPTCLCSQGFTGNLCQSCIAGHFGPKCLPCPSNCTKCDEGIAGSGRCLVPVLPTAAECKCVNGNCDKNGNCVCLPGWANSSNGTQCAQCAQGFFLSSTGGCQTCQIGCSSCSDITGNCITCQSAFTQNPTDKTKCDSVPTKTSNGVPCPTGSYNNGTGCASCSPICRTCNGGTSNDCIFCAGHRSKFNNSCVDTNADGICEGTQGMIADNNKRLCEGCGATIANCVTCKIPGYNNASTINLAQCTGCLAGTFLSNGKCIKTCPSGTFVLNNSTCTNCSSPCKTCAGAEDQCLSCTKGFASSGKCVNSCPKGTFSSNGTCANCHPDCGTCKGSSFNECLSCFPHLPALLSGRCLATCNANQFLNPTTSKCQNCDVSCSSCTGSGTDQCLACASPFFIVVNGTCSPVPVLLPASAFLSPAANRSSTKT